MKLLVTEILNLGFCVDGNPESTRRHSSYIRQSRFHYDDVIMGAMASQITSLTIVYSTVHSGQINENITAPRHWPLGLTSSVTDEFPAQMASNAENDSIWWRHHVLGFVGLWQFPLISMRVRLTAVKRVKSCGCRNDIFYLPRFDKPMPYIIFLSQKNEQQRY